MTYTVEITDAADAEIQAAYLRLNRRNPDFAGRWLEGLMRAIDGLDTFPRSHSIAPDGAVFGREVRRLLYKMGSTSYRVLFCLLDIDGDGEDDTVRVLAVRHGAQRPLDETDTDDDTR